jgi:hypothetical protein
MDIETIQFSKPDPKKLRFLGSLRWCSSAGYFQH